MKKEEYLRKLKYYLIDMPGEDLEQIENFYEELIYDGLEQGQTEEEIFEHLESPEEVAKKIRAEYGGLVVYTAKAKSKEEKNKKEYEASEMIHTVKVECENLRVRVKTVEQGPVRVYFKPQEDLDTVEFEEKNGIFSFTHKRKKKAQYLKNFFNMLKEWNKEYNILVLELPADFAGNLYIKTTNGTIRTAGLTGLSSAEFSSNNGMIKLENSFADDLLICSGNGRIELDNVRGERLDASAGNGLITVKECRFQQKISLLTQNGAITGRNLISDHIVMQTSNGLITGTIIGNQNDYNISSMTRNGFNNLENINESGRTKELTATTHNGRIQVDFTM